jgi:centrosomal protein CEP290
LEEERLDLKRKIRQMAQERGKRNATLGIPSYSIPLKELLEMSYLDLNFYVF